MPVARLAIARPPGGRRQQRADGEVVALENGHAVCIRQPQRDLVVGFRFVCGQPRQLDQQMRFFTGQGILHGDLHALQRKSAIETDCLIRIDASMICGST